MPYPPNSFPFLCSSKSHTCANMPTVHPVTLEPGGRLPCISPPMGVTIAAVTPGLNDAGSARANAENFNGRAGASEDPSIARASSLLQEGSIGETINLETETEAYNYIKARIQEVDDIDLEKKRLVGNVVSDYDVQNEFMKEFGFPERITKTRWGRSMDFQKERTMSIQLKSPKYRHKTLWSTSPSLAKDRKMPMADPGQWMTGSVMSGEGPHDTGITNAKSKVKVKEMSGVDSIQSIIARATPTAPPLTTWPYIALAMVRPVQPTSQLN